MSEERATPADGGVMARHPRLIYTILILAVTALALYVSTYAAAFFFGFGDIILVFFLAWLIAFMVTPLANLLARYVPLVNRAIAVVVVYVVLIAVVAVVVVYLAAVLASSVSSFLENLPEYQQDLPTILAPLQERLASVGLNVDLVALANGVVDWFRQNATEILNVIQSVAVASIGIAGNAIIVFFLSIYIAVDRDRIVSFLYRLVPPRFGDEARLFQVSVGKSFGGFIRSQVTQGVIFAALAAATSLLLGLQFTALTASLSGLLQAIPFFGPFISWAPPVIVAVFTKPEAILPALLIMGVGWFLTMNVIQPRLMAGALSIHPIVVLGSVIVGSKVAGIAGAVFAIPIAAVASAFFFYYLQRTERGRSVSERAAARVSAREGRRVRAPR
ncbi:MAG: AI-2E family transporter, partial [Chloroflexi bacterium]|nr:AI-2E family transporter [Chloroflexota bacterium]